MIKPSRNYKSHRHCGYNLKYHLVLVTKDRHKFFTPEILQRLKELCTEQAAHWEIELIEFGGEADHIHLLLDMHPNIMLSRFIRSLKNVTSRLIREELAEHMSQF